MGLSGEIIPVRTAEVKLLAHRPLRSGLRVDRASALLKARPLGIDDALKRFHCEWSERAVP
jgi:dTDP-4-dehydrorhamnose reductase